ncbi:MAG: hypothetical protein JWR42_1638 [Marmoricola sp.]|nr:hypothetical protein [Marmoricola sp.]
MTDREPETKFWVVTEEGKFEFQSAAAMEAFARDKAPSARAPGGLNLSGEGRLDLTGERVDTVASKPFAERQWEHQEQVRLGLLIGLLVVTVGLILTNLACAVLADGATYKLMGAIIGSASTLFAGWLGQVIGHYTSAK